MATTQDLSLCFLGPAFRLPPTQSPSVNPAYPLCPVTPALAICCTLWFLCLCAPREARPLAPMEYPWKRVCVQIPLYLATISVPGTSVLVILMSFSRLPRSGSCIKAAQRSYAVHSCNSVFSRPHKNMTHHALSISLLYPHLNDSRFQHCLKTHAFLVQPNLFCYAQLAAYRNRLLTVLRPRIRCSTY
ncbi:hypothetical protein GSI_10865 [Ganoderma sinense ZZ0214-1]|uniref:Uncharacterized protein n=1 Tax=Ganoderma sinense ZZ0214-1 TaxID=1077348 RepID=A0A2G8S1S6_9APHY|nr:hypothetical protein GSI_10865 [Ganoderma sinense ZZ0214-1]